MSKLYNNKIIIRKAQLSDLRNIVRLHRSALPSTPNSMVGEWLITILYSTIIKNNDSIILIAESESTLIGILSATKSIRRTSNKILFSMHFSERLKYLINILSNPYAIFTEIQHRLFMLVVRAIAPVDYAAILTICVSKKYRKQNVGSLLIKKLFRYSSYKNVYVDTYSSNSNAQHFYIKNGFQSIITSFGSVLLFRGVNVNFNKNILTNLMSYFYILDYKLKSLITTTGVNKLKIKVLYNFGLKKLIVGSLDTYQKGWISSDIDALNICNSSDWEKLFHRSTLSNIVAEHVWEHLTKEEAALAALNAYNYLEPEGRLRIAVPDGNFPSKKYIDSVIPGGPNHLYHEHKVLYNYRSIVKHLKNVGYQVRLLEYWDANGRFHSMKWSNEDGYISRSRYNDPRNDRDNVRYTSLILDAIKIA